MTTQATWPGLAGLPALVGRAGFARKSVQLPFATDATPTESDAPEILWGSGDPNGASVGRRGDLFIQEDAADARVVWTKAIGDGNSTGWFRLQTWEALKFFSLVDYGAKDDLTVDSTSAILATFTAAQLVGGTTVVPPGRFLFTAALTVTTNMSMLGSGYESRLVMGSGVAGTVDALKIIPGAGVAIRRQRFANFVITKQSGTPGRHAIHVDLTASGAFLADVTFAELWLDALGGKGFNLTNPTNTDGFFTSTIKDSLIYNGIMMERAGDSLHILRNTLTGANIGIDLSMVSGARQIHVDDNNITNAGGAVVIRSGAQIFIRRNQIEQNVAYTGAEVANIVIKGDVGQVAEAHIEENNVNSLDRLAYNISVDNAVETKIRGNILDADATDKHINVTANATRTRIADDNTGYTSGAGGGILRIDNAGVQTIGVPYAQSSFSNAWVAFDAVNFPVRFYRDEAGVVRIEGKVKDGTVTAGTTIFTLPAGFRPDTNLDFASVSGTTFASVRVDSGGNVQIMVGVNTSLSFAGIAFKVPL
jgi:hypothetical protein